MNKLIDNQILRAAAAIVLAITPLAAAAQTATPRPPDKKTSYPPYPEAPISRPATPAPYPKPDPVTHGSFERSIKVDPQINLILSCVREGTVKVNGWNRNEVRVLIDEGSKFAFSTLEKNPKTGEPVWIKVVSVESKNKYGSNNECISGGEIQVDAPVSAAVTIKGYDIATTVDAIRKVEVAITGGDVAVRNVAKGVKVSAGRGDVTVDSSQGAMDLLTTTGNIMVFQGGPSEFGDDFRAKTTNGAIALQSLEYRKTTVNSISGSVAYTGEIKSSGSYAMTTNRGSLRLTIPERSSFQMWATYGSGTFFSELPVDLATENITPGPIKTIRGKLGSNDATLKLETTNGSILIKKM
ncbi:MAG: DUF4097 family beta strand repeat-containing protein [Pyrinomonadaceae bacterium]